MADQERLSASTAFAARVVSSTDEIPAVRRVWVAPERAFVYRAGQVAELVLAGETERRLFAIASAPHEAREVMLLIRTVGSEVPMNPDALDAGRAVELHGPLGPGFPLEDAVGRDLLLVAVGTAAAPLRSALVEALTRRGDFGRVAFVHGVRHLGDVCFAAEHDAWRRQGVDVRVVLSRPADADAWRGPVGWVQEHLADLVTPATTAFVVGMPAMEAATEARLLELGVARGAIHNNFG
ncbi:MAG: hypothetical protein KC635_28630 [Myxococcales bacterium]|nr:hypothetical protein [Myxococcales bacterium]